MFRFQHFRSDLNSFGSWHQSETLSSFRPLPEKIENHFSQKMDPHLMSDPHSTDRHVNDPDSDPEDDPGKMLNVWLGELDNLKKVILSITLINTEIPN